jgi:hypothetical protein
LSIIKFYNFSRPSALVLVVSCLMNLNFKFEKFKHNFL